MSNTTIKETSDIKFCRNGEPVSASLNDPTETLLDYLRLREGSNGTKEGCCEGDCGACTVVIGEEVNGTIEYKPINSCITLLGMIHGKDVVTVDDLAASDGTLHPVQQAMVDNHGSQCGFCTPGFVMSLFSLYEQEAVAMDREAVTKQLAGNLCRCTGYRPIVDAGIESSSKRDTNSISARKLKAQDALQALKKDFKNDLFAGNNERFFAQPNSIESLADLYQTHPEATIVAGATDVGLWVTKRLSELPKIIHIGNVQGFTDVSETDEAIIIGAGATYAHAYDALKTIDPDIGDLIDRIGSVQVRSAGTIGGNIANGSPIGDTPPLLIALNAQLTLQKGQESRTIPLEDYFIKYGQQDREPGEFVRSIYVPKLNEGEHLRTYKLSKRFDQDISAVMMAIKISVATDGTLKDVRIAYGGMAEIPKRATSSERALVSKSLFSSEIIAEATRALSDDFTPIGDMRASADYRLMAAEGLLKKALIEISTNANNGTTAVSRIIARSAADEGHAL